MLGNNAGIYYYVLEYKLYQAEREFSTHCYWHHIFFVRVISRAGFRKINVRKKRCAKVNKLFQACLQISCLRNWNPKVLGPPPLGGPGPHGHCQDFIPWSDSWPCQGVAGAAGQCQDRKPRLAKRMVCPAPPCLHALIPPMALWSQMLSKLRPESYVVWSHPPLQTSFPPWVPYPIPVQGRGKKAFSSIHLRFLV